MPGAHGLVPCVLWRSPGGLAGDGPGHPGGTCWFCPGPQAGEPAGASFRSRAPGGAAPWPGALWPSARRWGARRHLVRARPGGWRRAGFSLCSGEVRVSWLSGVLTRSRTLRAAALGGIPRRAPPASPGGELGALQLLSAAPLGARGAGRLPGDPASRRPGARSLSLPGLFSYSLFFFFFKLPATLLAEAHSQQSATTVAKRLGGGRCVLPGLALI